MEKVVYKVGNFIVFAGYEREVVLCAVSQECYKNIEASSSIGGWSVYGLTSTDNFIKISSLLYTRI